MRLCACNSKLLSCCSNAEQCSARARGSHLNRVRCDDRLDSLAPAGTRPIAASRCCRWRLYSGVAAVQRITRKLVLLPRANLFRHLFRHSPWRCVPAHWCPLGTSPEPDAPRSGLPLCLVVISRELPISKRLPGDAIPCSRATAPVRSLLSTVGAGPKRCEHGSLWSMAPSSMCL